MNRILSRLTSWREKKKKVVLDRQARDPHPKGCKSDALQESFSPTAPQPLLFLSLFLPLDTCPLTSSVAKACSVPFIPFFVCFVFFCSRISGNHPHFLSHIDVPSPSARLLAFGIRHIIWVVCYVTHYLRRFRVFGESRVASSVLVGACQ